MTIRRRDLVTGGVALAACGRLTGIRAPASDVEAIAEFERGQDRVNFSPTTIVERDALRSVARDVLIRGAVDPMTQDLVARARLQLEQWQVSSGPVFVIREPDDQRRGVGVYAFRSPLADHRPCLLQAPHAFHDAGTASIAASLFFGPRAANFTALFVNTLHRYRPTAEGDEVRAGSPSDLAHVNTHLFNHGTIAVARILGEVDVVQLHGFGNREVRRRDSERKPGKPRAIVASGRPESTRYSQAIAAHLRDSFGVGVWSYPEKAGELGGLDNAQARTLAAFPGTRFVHLEMALRMRKDLRANPSSVRDLEAALLAGRAVI